MVPGKGVDPVAPVTGEQHCPFPAAGSSGRRGVLAGRLRVVTALMGIAYGLIASLSYPRWAYLAVHIPALLVGGVWAGRSARSLGWLHGLLVGLGYAAAAFWLMPHSGSLQLADLFRALTLSLPVALLGGVLGRNLVSAT